MMERLCTPDPDCETGEPHKQFCSIHFWDQASRIAWCIVSCMTMLVSRRLFDSNRFKNIFEPRAH